MTLSSRDRSSLREGRAGLRACEEHDHAGSLLAAVRSFAQAETYNFTEYDDIVVHMKKITDHLGWTWPSTRWVPRPTATSCSTSPRRS